MKEACGSTGDAPLAFVFCAFSPQAMFPIASK